MVCDTIYRRRQTPQVRSEEIREATKRLMEGLTSGRIKPKISKKGAIAFEGFTETERDGISDECAYRRIMSGSSQSAKLAIMRAEQVQGVRVNLTQANGEHSHDGGRSWSPGH